MKTPTKQKTFRELLQAEITRTGLNAMQLSNALEHMDVAQSTVYGWLAPPGTTQHREPRNWMANAVLLEVGKIKSKP